MRGKRWALAVAIVGSLMLPAAAQAGVAPNAVGQLDCDGFSSIWVSASLPRCRAETGQAADLLISCLYGRGSAARAPSRSR